MDVIAIDGVASSGKGTLAKALAKKINYLHLDTGALYRAATVCILNEGIDPFNEKAVVKRVKHAKIEANLVNGEEHYFLDGEDLSLSNSLRTPEVNIYVSKISKYAKLREQIRKIQKKIAKHNNCVVEGRDITTVVFPKAKHKFYIVADTLIRAQRRQKDYEKQGKIVPIEDVVKMIEERDRDDIERDISPMYCPSDAHVIDNGKNTVEQSVNEMLSFIK